MRGVNDILVYQTSKSKSYSVFNHCELSQKRTSLMIISVCGSMRDSLTTCSTLDLTRHRTTIRASWCQCHKTFFASSPTLQRNKLERLSLLSPRHIIMQRLRFTHRHLSIIDSLSFVMCPLLAPLEIGFFSFFAAVYSTNEANKAGGTRH